MNGHLKLSVARHDSKCLVPVGLDLHSMELQNRTQLAKAEGIGTRNGLL